MHKGSHGKTHDVVLATRHFHVYLYVSLPRASRESCVCCCFRATNRVYFDVVTSQLREKKVEPCEMPRIPQEESLARGLQ